MNPILKWAGGKRWLLPLLKDTWEPYKGMKLVEPFSGGLAIALGLNPNEALLNDANEHLINFYQQVQKGLNISFQLKNDSTFYYAMRDNFNVLIRKKNFKNKKAARLFYFLVKTGFNGLCRFNKAGEFNVPFGQHKSINYRKSFIEYQPILSNWHFTHQDFESLILKKNDFLYVDPPYDVEFTQYHAKGFNWNDQIRLAHWLVSHEGPVIASNQATPRILNLYKKLEFKIFTLPAPRRISCNGDRRKVFEMLALKGLDKECVTRLKKKLQNSAATQHTLTCSAP